MNRRQMKKLFEGIDEMSMPSIEKVLPREAVDKATAYGVEKRSAFPKLAAVSLAVVALVVATALVIGSVAGGNEKQIDPDNSLVLNNDSENTSIPAVLENEISNSEASAEHTSTEESEAPRKDMPIVSCGSYTGVAVDCVHYVPYGEVAIETMRGGCPGDVDELQDGVLYAVYFSADYIGDGSYFAQTEYRNGLRRLEEEAQEEMKEQAEIIIDYLKQNEQEEYEELLSWYKHRIEVYPSEDNYDDFCRWVINYVYSYYRGAHGYHTGIDQYDGMGNPPEWFVPIDTDIKKIEQEYEDKCSEYKRIAREKATAKMYEYLEGLGIKFYDKTVYFIGSESKGGKVYRVAFLTKEEIAALKGGEDYGIRVVQVFEELAKQDNEPVYISPYFICD